MSDFKGGIQDVLKVSLVYGLLIPDFQEEETRCFKCFLCLLTADSRFKMGNTICFKVFLLCVLLIPDLTERILDVLKVSSVYGLLIPDVKRWDNKCFNGFLSLWTADSRFKGGNTRCF